jgi:outer membrane murein-binding lipoprotein Lpp
MAGCLRNASHEEIAAEVAELNARLLTAKVKAQAAKVEAAKVQAKNAPQPQTATPQVQALPVAVPAALLNGVNLPGADYANFSIASGEPTLCQNACRADNKCVAWTYVEPRRQGEEARCWLKSRVPTQTQSSCCTSGIERGENRPIRSESTKSN